MDYNWLQRPNLKLSGFKNAKIILDCDPGHDDALAIMLAIASDDIDLGITCVGGNATLENTNKRT